MFVCHGNICRSPMAQFVFLDILRKNGEDKDFLVDSSATSYEEIGNPLYPPVRQLLDKAGISYHITYAKKLVSEDYGRYDLFVCMDERNIRMIRNIFATDRDKKVWRLLDFTDDKRDVSDPYYTRDFSSVFEDIKMGCQGLYDYFKRDKCKV
jgi:protein-tyrosine phosphatase